ncbi:MAG: hypothetical protein L3K09_07970 [Thermoplasmata archaeon]|nr:hypothetical protein [Thermoplasmata archaeon]
MRALTESEARVIAALLSSTAVRERERLARMRVPRSTYHAARKRAYSEGWLKDRYIPDPSRFGLPIATFLLARPYADRWEELLAEWGAQPTNVVSWGSPQFALGVFFHKGTDEADRMIARFADRHFASSTASLVANLHEPSVPVFFDYEGLWSHLTDVEGTIGYPHGLGGTPAAEPESLAASRHHRWAATELAQRPFEAAAQGRPDHLVGPLGLPFSQQKLIRQGWISHRVLLEPSQLPAFRGRQADQVLFIYGELKAGARPEQLFAVLTRECRVYPFLYVSQSGRLLIGGLGGIPATPPPGAPAGESRRPVMATLQQALRGIEIVQESAASLTIATDHRYDRLLPRGG